MSVETYQSKIPKYAGHTAGPWRWELSLALKQVRLCGGVVKYDLKVMDFVRWGMSNAAPRFNLERRENLHLMTRADELSVIVPGREHHADWFRNIDHPDAALIADAPYLACEVERLAALCGELQSRIKDLKADLGILDECHDDIYDDRQGNANTRDYQ